MVFGKGDGPLIEIGPCQSLQHTGSLLTMFQQKIVRHFEQRRSGEGGRRFIRLSVPEIYEGLIGRGYRRRIGTGQSFNLFMGPPVPTDIIFLQ